MNEQIRPQDKNKTKMPIKCSSSIYLISHDESQVQQAAQWRDQKQYPRERRAEESKPKKERERHSVEK